VLRPPASDQDSTRIDVLHEQWRPITENIEQFTDMGDDNFYQVEAVDPDGLWIKGYVHPVPAPRRLICGAPRGRR
jgi:hypothetical protein